VEPLISHRFDITDAPAAYAVMTGNEPSLGMLLRYPGVVINTASRTLALARPGGIRHQGAAHPAVSFIGSGNYATSRLIPAFKLAGAHLRSVASSAGVSGTYAARKFGFDDATTDVERVMADADTTAVVVSTRHDSHAGLVMKAIRAGKHVFVEKPLCLRLEEVDQIEAACQERADQDLPVPLLMVGFNRRFAPQVQKIRQLLAAASERRAFVMTVNAGAIPASHWTQDSDVGGGRIVGEACHFIDLLRFLADSPIADAQVTRMASATSDTVSINLAFANGSIGTVHYLANGNKALPKERLEVYCEGRVLQLDNFRTLRGFGWPGFSKLNLWKQDKGQAACAKAFLEAISGRAQAPIPLHEILEVARATILVAGGKR
jgi:predicted dehydrogenase